MLWQCGAGQRLSDGVVTDVGDLAQTVEQAERLQDPGIDADADTGVPRFDSLQGRTGREGALGYDRHRQPPAPTGIVDVRPELAQRTSHGSGRIVRRRHYVNFALQIRPICSTKMSAILDSYGQEVEGIRVLGVTVSIADQRWPEVVDQAGTMKSQVGPLARISRLSNVAKGQPRASANATYQASWAVKLLRTAQTLSANGPKGRGGRCSLRMMI